MNNYLFTSFLLSFIITSFLLITCIPNLRKLKIGQSIREEGPSSHLIKQGTPTMGGLILVIGFSLSFIVLGINELRLTINQTLMILIPCYIYLLIGFIDDLLIIINKNNKGISPRMKILLQIIGLLIYYLLFLKNHNTIINFYFIEIDIKHFYFIFVLLIYLASTNAVNLTDGLDGLASGLIIICLIGTTIIGLLKQRDDIVLFSITIISSLLSFLIFNFNPAKIFMGNSGSLMLGSVLATIFVLLEEELMLLILGIVFIIETLSVIIQVIYFKLSKGKRIFLMAPLHHHFEKKGNNEITIDLLFWIIGIIALLSLLIVIL